MSLKQRILDECVVQGADYTYENKFNYKEPLAATSLNQLRKFDTNGLAEYLLTFRLHQRVLIDRQEITETFCSIDQLLQCKKEVFAELLVRNIYSDLRVLVDELHHVIDNYDRTAALKLLDKIRQEIYYL
jgi:hypothetical protein